MHVSHPTIVIVIGSNGKIGSKLVEGLLKHNIAVIGVGRSKNYRVLNVQETELKNFTYLRGDITKTSKLFQELNLLLTSLSNQQPVNLILYNLTTPKKSDWQNVQKTTILTKKIRFFYQGLAQLKKEKFCNHINYITSGSYSEYSYLSALLTNQALPQRTHNYFEFKTLSQLLSRQYAELYQIPTQYIIISHTYGVSSPDIIDSAIKKFSKKETIDLNSDGKQIIPFVYIDDLVDDLIKVGFIENSPEIFSLYYSNSQELPLKEILTTIQKYFEALFQTKLLLTSGKQSETIKLPPLKRFTKNPTSLNNALTKIIKNKEHQACSKFRVK